MSKVTPLKKQGQTYKNDIRVERQKLSQIDTKVMSRKIIEPKWHRSSPMCRGQGLFRHCNCIMEGHDFDALRLQAVKRNRRSKSIRGFLLLGAVCGRCNSWQFRLCRCNRGAEIPAGKLQKQKASAGTKGTPCCCRGHSRAEYWQSCMGKGADTQAKQTPPNQNGSNQYLFGTALLCGLRL